MHRGCFVWMLTLPLSGRRMPGPGPVRVCMCVPPLTGLGGPASPARFHAPHLFLWPVLVRSLFVRPVPGWGCPVCGCCWVFHFFSCCAPVVSGVPCFPARDALGLGVLWSSGPAPAPPFFFFVHPLVSGIPWFPGQGAAGLGALWSSCLVPLFVFFPSSPPLFFCGPCSFFLFVSSSFVFHFFLFVFCLGVPVVRFFGWFVCRGLWGVLVCVAVGVVPRRGPVCACAVSLGASWLCTFCVCCCLSCCGVVVCFVICPVLCGVPVVGLVLAPCCCPLLPLPDALSWPVIVFSPGVRCCVAPVCRLSCAVLLSASCLAGGAVLFRSRWLVLCVVACGCRLFVAGSGCLLLFFAGVCCRGCSCLAV